MQEHSMDLGQNNIPNSGNASADISQYRLDARTGSLGPHPVTRKNLQLLPDIFYIIDEENPL